MLQRQKNDFRFREASCNPTRLSVRQVKIVTAFLSIAALCAAANFSTHKTFAQQSRVERPQTAPAASATTAAAAARPTQEPATQTRERNAVALPVPPPPPPPARLNTTQNTTPQPSQTPPAAIGGEQGQEVDPGEVLDIDSSLINLQVRVIDRQNRPINTIQQSEFRVFENGEPQEITFFTREEVPISYGLAIDTSVSLREQIDKVIEASKSIVESNKPGDETSVITFTGSNEINLVQDFSSSKKDIVDQLDDLHVDAGQTAVIDAVYLATEHVAGYRSKTGDNDKRRRALIVVTDGEEKGSQYKQDQLFNYLREQGVQIYVIGFVSELDTEGNLIRKSSRDKAVALINRLAKETGGRAFFPESVSELPQIAEQITRDLRTQFVISYSPTNKRRDGTFRAVKVETTPGAKGEKRIVLTRAGYTAPRDGGSNGSSTNSFNNSSAAKPTASSNKDAKDKGRPHK